MVGGLVVFSAMAVGLAPLEMAEVVAQRLSALDKLTVDVTLEVYGAHSDVPVLDRAAWDTLIDTYPFRLTISRPNLRAEFLKDDAAMGFVPVVASVYDGIYTSREVGLARDGRAHYVVVPAAQSGVLRWHPLLQVFDLGIYDSAPPGRLNILDVLRHPSAVLVRSAAGVATYAASVPGSGYSIRFELDINERGTPLRIKSALDYDNANIPPSYYEQFALRTAEINGAEFPMETAITHWGAAMPNFWNVWLYRVTNVQVREDLVADEVRVNIEQRNARVTEYLPHGGVHQTVYDDAGQIAGEDDWFTGAEPADPGAIVSRDSIRWRMCIPPGAALIGLTVATLLTYWSRHGPR